MIFNLVTANLKNWANKKGTGGPEQLESLPISDLFKKFYYSKD